MNAFYEHHKDNLEFGYRCFDRLLLKSLIQPFQQPERILGFFIAYRDGTRVTRPLRTAIVDQYQNWVVNRSQKWGQEFKQRWVNQYNFYVNDPYWGPMFVRMCPYFPFSARICCDAAA